MVDEITTSGMRLVEERKRMKMTQLKLADLIGVTPLTARNYEKNRPIPSDKLQILSNEGFDINYIVTGVATDIGCFDRGIVNINNEIKNMSTDGGCFSPDANIVVNLNDYAWIPLYNVEVSAGAGRFADRENILTYYSMSKYSLNKRRLTDYSQLGYVIVHGDSMYDTLRPSDCILINFAKCNPDGGVFVLRVGDALHVKRLILEKDCIRVISDNKRYPEWTLSHDDDFEIIGKYEWVSRYAD